MSDTYTPLKNVPGPFAKSLPTTVQTGGLLAGTGSPEGVVAANVGQLYQDTATDELYQKQAGTGKLGWTLIGMIPTTSAGPGGGATQVFSGTALDPNGVITATGAAIYHCTVDGAVWVKDAAGSANTGWTQILA